jgi:hypothetical protein
MSLEEFADLEKEAAIEREKASANAEKGPRK